VLKTVETLQAVGYPSQTPLKDLIRLAGGEGNRYPFPETLPSFLAHGLFNWPFGPLPIRSQSQ